ncbi:hypothetical protein C2S51_026055 [Perilla frutescens var. frutescens]|nr:hypothetical protein C2S51_026055 [Perilla frutescens var. frutescens]
MEAFLPYLLSFLLVLLPLSLYLVSMIRRKWSDDDGKSLPPGTNGWPILGENMKFAQLGPEKFVKERMEKYSPEVFQTSLLGEKMAVFCGARGNKFLFTNENKLVTSWMPQSLRKALVYPEIGLKEEFSMTRILHDDILTREALKRYIPVMDALAREHLDRDWKPNSVVKVLPLSKNYTFELTCRVFMSVVDPDRIKRLFDPFTLVTEGMLSLPVDIPGTAYNRTIKGGKMVSEELIKIIKERRKMLMTEEIEHESSVGRDLMSKMVMVKDEDGQFLSDKEISHYFIGLLVASFDTTTSAITTIINYLAQLPHIYSQVFKEQMEIAESKAPGDLLKWEDVEKMKYSWNVARESLRLMPPAQGTFGETKTEFTYGGFTIPKGWKTFWTVHSSHKNPDYFPEPEKFDPSRFEGSGPPPYTFVPFGGGPRMCPGKEYAKLELLVFIHNVVTRFKLHKTIPDEKIVFYASPTPVHGLPLHLQPHQN